MTQDTKTDSVVTLASHPIDEFVPIPAGSFIMGAGPRDFDARDDERPPRHVEIRSDFLMGRFPVTVGAFRRYCASVGRSVSTLPPPEFDNHPMVNVALADVQGYIKWKNQAAGTDGSPDAFRLPSEAEWEYACRAGTTTPFWTGDSIEPEQANFDARSLSIVYRDLDFRGGTTPIGTFAPNAWGLFDLVGNVWEWTADSYVNSFGDGQPNDGAAFVGADRDRIVIRGGCWNSPRRQLRSAARNWTTPYDRNGGLGFRLVKADAK